MVHQTELIIHSNIKWRGLKMNNPAQHSAHFISFLSCLYEHVK